MVNVRVEMPRTSCHLSIFSLGKLGGWYDGRQAGLDGPRCRRLAREEREESDTQKLLTATRTGTKTELKKNIADGRRPPVNSFLCHFLPFLP